MNTYEANFDGLVGPTHNYAGLSGGNLASIANANAVSDPKAAALQGLKKMKALADLGLVQGVLAPQARPDIKTLRQLGFSGSESQILTKAYKTAPALLASCFSASSMWAANAATVSPSSDSADHKIHFTPANLTSKFHRSIEPYSTGKILQAVFADKDYFVHHSVLPNNASFGDEGAANHTRLCQGYGDTGLEIFTYGKAAFDSTQPAPMTYPARQTLEASQAIARLHALNEQQVIYVQQNPDVIDQGVFHNDVIAVGNQNVLLYHQHAFLNKADFITELTAKFQSCCPETRLHLIEVNQAEVPVLDAISSYLFNTQLVTLDNGTMAIIAPQHCAENMKVKTYLEELLASENPIASVHAFGGKERVKNGGGPACLRLRVVLNEQERLAVNQACWLTDDTYMRLVAWVEKHYRDRLSSADFCDPALLDECRTALDELSQILALGSVYDFQQV